MIDLIIPYYNNPEGLKRTLNSINTDIFYITIIDDHSAQPIPFPTIADQVYRTNINNGPGNARQLGIEKTHNSYIMFLDTGDIFLSKELQQEIATIIESDPEVNIFYWTYIYKGKITDHGDNRMHAKVYKREFLDKYNITFCKEGSYMDEDIGFNRTCRIISRAINIPIRKMDYPIIEWVMDENSITQKNNCEVLYRDQTKGLALNSIHSINICRKNNIDVGAEINEIGGYLYYWFIYTLVNRPEYAQQAWAGAKIFFDAFSNKIHLTNMCLHPNKIKECFKWRTDGKLKIPINLYRFNEDIIKFSEIPKFYI